MPNVPSSWQWNAIAVILTVLALAWSWQSRRRVSQDECQYVHFRSNTIFYLKATISSEQQFALEHGCQPLRPWKARWPLGLDMLVNASRYASQKQILRFFLDVVDESGVTFEQNLLGARSVDTIDPRNIEAVLSTDFAGMCPASLRCFGLYQGTYFG